MAAYFGARTTDFLVKAAVVIIGLHVLLAMFVPSYYTLLTSREYSLALDFVNAIVQVLRNFFGSFLGFF